jgi:uncharacterized C2H2 Zn-finger protein
MLLQLQQDQQIQPKPCWSDFEISNDALAGYLCDPWRGLDLFAADSSLGDQNDTMIEHARTTHSSDFPSPFTISESNSSTKATPPPNCAPSDLEVLELSSLWFCDFCDFIGETQAASRYVERQAVPLRSITQTDTEPSTHQARHHCLRAGCTRSFTLRKDLARHVQSRHDRVRIPCLAASCDKFFRRKDTMQRHMKSSHATRGC